MIAGFFTAGIDIISVRRNGVGQHDAIFIHIILLVADFQPSIAYIGAVRLQVTVFAVLILLPSGGDGPHIGPGIGPVHIDQVFPHFRGKIAWINSSRQTDHINVAFPGGQDLIVCHQCDAQGRLCAFREGGLVFRN